MKPRIRRVSFQSMHMATMNAPAALTGSCTALPKAMETPSVRVPVSLVRRLHEVADVPLLGEVRRWGGRTTRSYMRRRRSMMYAIGDGHAEARCW